MKTTFNLILAGALSLAVYSCNNETREEAKTDADATKMGMQDAKDTAEATNNAVMSTPQQNDAEFVTEVAAANMAEMNVQKSALAHGTSKDVKDNAKHMQADHKKLADELTAYAKANNITLPGDADNDKKADLAEMEKKKGKDYDKAYADHIVDAHEKLIKKFENNEGKRTDAALNKWVADNLPTLRTHLDMAKALESKME
jgi:putative membrane protein